MNCAMPPRDRACRDADSFRAPDLQGLCLPLADWWAELRLIERELGLNAEKPVAAGAGRARKNRRRYWLMR